MKGNSNLAAASGETRSIRNPHNLCEDVATLHDEPSQGDWELESPRPCAAGIEIEHAVSRLLLWLVTVAGGHDVESGGFGLEIEAREIVQDIDGNAGELDDFGFGEFARPPVLIDVSADRG